MAKKLFVSSLCLLVVFLFASSFLNYLCPIKDDRLGLECINKIDYLQILSLAGFIVLFLSSLVFHVKEHRKNKHDNTRHVFHYIMMLSAVMFILFLIGGLILYLNFDPIPF